MSGFYVAKYDDRIEALTDGGVYAHDGTVVSIERKIWCSDRLPLIYVGRGNHASVELMGAALGVMSFNRSVDETLVLFKDKIESFAGQSGEKVKMDGVIAGISETLGAVIYYFNSDPECCAVGGLEPFKLYEVSGEMLAASNPTPHAYKASGLPMYWAVDGLAEYGGKFFNLLRQFKMPHVAHPDKPELFAIGGHVDHTVVKVDGIISNRILKWPDKIGGKIDPGRIAV